jgi:hypothetical protein
MTRPLPDPQTEFQRLAMERALLLAREMEAVSAKAPDGLVLHRLEKLLLTQGRDFQRGLLEESLQHVAHEAAKKGGPHGPAPADTPDATKAPPHETSSPRSDP